MKRKMIVIEAAKCNGCGDCIPGCPEGALQIIDGKARLVSDLLCDGLGACLGHCPTGAITVIEREAEPYDEAKVLENLLPQGLNTIKAHLKHLKDHGQTAYYETALTWLKQKGVPVTIEETALHAESHGGCPGSRSMNFAAPAEQAVEAGPQPSALTHWPVQLHLISPMAPQYQGADVLLAADCVAFAAGDFHSKWLKGRKLAIACPKLDDNQEVYVEKLTALIDQARINTLTVLIMEVPCCGGLLQTAQAALAQAKRKLPLKAAVISLKGELIQEEWV